LTGFHLFVWFHAFENNGMDGISCADHDDEGTCGICRYDGNDCVLFGLGREGLMEPESASALLYREETGASIYDGLTGLFNHGFFQLMLEREIKRSERQGRPGTLALVDIGGFNRYNLKHGYIAGDRLLKEVAGLLSENIRTVDFAFRFAGDQFALLLIDASTEQALTVVERIQSEARKRLGESLNISIGLADFPRNASNPQDLLQKVKEAVQQAKTRGGDGICFFEPMRHNPDQEKSCVLIVDDNELNLKLIEAILSDPSYEILTASNGEEALAIIQKKEVDLVHLDVMMPGLDGFEVCRRIKSRENTRLIPVVLITGLGDLESRVKGMESGADDFITKPVNRIEIRARTKSLIRNKKLNDRLTNIENVLFSLANAVEAKDRYTQGHTTRVATTAISLGRRMGLEEKELEALRIGGILHDIGKIGVPEFILNKPGPLDDHEWEAMKQHCDIGHKICHPLGKTLGLALEVIRSHHEKLDQSGYPDGLPAECIPIVVRIMAVADIYDALITERPYRPALARAEAFDILKKEGGAGKLDSKVVENMIQMVVCGR
jgi:putative two-component system response regulator